MEKKGIISGINICFVDFVNIYPQGRSLIHKVVLYPQGYSTIY